MEIRDSLINIQQALNAPKKQFNKFGGYKYRNAEDILEAVKPLLKANDCSMTIFDEIVQIGDRYYVKATVTLMGADKQISVSAFAREEEAKKGMDGSQITGASSSYARKYALNGLFLIDDSKDSDFTNTHDKKEEVQVRNFVDRLSKCTTHEELTEIYQEMNDEEKKAHKDLIQSIKRRIYKNNFDSILKNMKKNHWTEKKQFDLEDLISKEQDGEEQKTMIKKLEARLSELGFDYKYEKLPWEE